MPTRTKPLLSAERLRELLNYDPETGIFTRRVTRGNSAAGSIAGNPQSTNDYTVIWLDGVVYKTHRLAWLYVYGEDPGDFYINHINSDTLDNRIANLELVTHRQNIQHAAEHGNMRTVLPLGVRWHKSNQKYSASISIKDKRYYLGGYADPDMAHTAYTAALEAVETIMVAYDQYPVLLTTAVEAATGVRLKFRAPRDLPTGVCRSRGRFKAVINKQGKRRHLGTFDTLEEASAAYKAARAALDS